MGSAGAKTIHEPFVVPLKTMMHIPVRKILRRIFRPDYKNDFGWRMRH